MRRSLVIGNWKMNGSRALVAELISGLQRQLSELNRTDVVVCPPHVYLDAARHSLLNSPFVLGAQNVCAESDGAFTGEVSAAMLRDCGCRYVIVGHSERRTLFGEDNALVAEKAAAVLAQQLVPVICLGESLSERDGGNTLVVIQAQLEAVLKQLDKSALNDVVWAYEPVWAIGSGRSASAEQVQEVHAFIRQQLQAVSERASEARVLYGGSVKPGNAAEIFAQPDVDGGLIGGASLNAEEFSAICRAAE